MLAMRRIELDAGNAWRGSRFYSVEDNGAAFEVLPRHSPVIKLKGSKKNFEMFTL